MSKRLFSFSTIGIFLAGAIFGAVVLHLSFRYRMWGGAHEERRNRVEWMMRRLDRELDLSDEQEKELLPIVREMSEKIRVIRADTYPRFQALMDVASQKAMPLLSEEQKKRLLEMERRIKDHFVDDTRDRAPRPEQTQSN